MLDTVGENHTLRILWYFVWLKCACLDIIFKDLLVNTTEIESWLQWGFESIRIHSFQIAIDSYLCLFERIWATWWAWQVNWSCSSHIEEFFPKTAGVSWESETACLTFSSFIKSVVKMSAQVAAQVHALLRTRACCIESHKRTCFCRIVFGKVFLIEEARASNILFTIACHFTVALKDLELVDLRFTLQPVKHLFKCDIALVI